MGEVVPKVVDELVEKVEGLFPEAKLVFSGRDSPDTRGKISNELKKILSLVATALAADTNANSSSPQNSSSPSISSPQNSADSTSPVSSSSSSDATLQ